MSNADELLKLKKLFEDGVISEEEFNKEKDKILSSNKKIKRMPINSDLVKLDSKKLKYTFIVMFLVISSWYFYSNSSTTTTNSSEIINMLAPDFIDDDKIAYLFSYNSYDDEPHYQSSDGMYNANHFKYTEKVEFMVAYFTYEDDIGGQFYLCKSKSECDEIYEHYDSYRGLVGPYLFRSKDGKLVAQISKKTPKDTARKFEEIFTNLRNINARSTDCTGKWCFINERNDLGGD